MSRNLPSSSSEPRIDVVVPVYNAAPYLEECMASIFTQEGARLRVIAVDDCSTDGSLEVLNRLKKSYPQLTVLANERNSGPGATRNRALEACDAPWLVFVDADDALMPGAISRLVKIQRATGAEVVQGAYEGHEGRPCSSRNVLVMSGSEACDKVLYRENGMHPSACAGIYSRRLWLGVGFPPGILYEDLAKVPLVMANAARVAYTPQTLYHYRDTPGSIMNTFTPQRLDVLEVTRLLEERRHNAAARQRRFSAAFNMLGLLLRYNPANREAIARCETQIKRLRTEVARDSRVRLKVRLGAVAAHLGMPLVKLLLRLGQ